MKMNKDFDCVEMKNEIQARLLKEWEGMSSSEISTSVNNQLASSSSPIAKLWCRIKKHNQGSRALAKC